MVVILANKVGLVMVVVLCDMLCELEEGREGNKRNGLQKAEDILFLTIERLEYAFRCIEVNGGIAKSSWLGWSAWLSSEHNNPWQQTWMLCLSSC